jgi:hypothetical protein
MLRRLALVTGIAAALMVPAASALAYDVNHPALKAGGCGANAGTLTVLGPSSVLSYSGGGADLSGCL